jgi:hypothetical protein
LGISLDTPEHPFAQFDFRVIEHDTEFFEVIGWRQFDPEFRVSCLIQDLVDGFTKFIDDDAGTGWHWRQSTARLPACAGRFHIGGPLVIGVKPEIVEFALFLWVCCRRPEFKLLAGVFHEVRTFSARLALFRAAVYRLARA